MTSLVIDTNTLLRFLLNDIPSQYKLIHQKIQQAKAGKIKLIIPQIVMFEIIYTLDKVYGFDKRKILQGIQEIFSSDYLEIQDKEIFIETTKMYENSNKVSVADCFISSFAKANDAKLFSFDKDLNKLVSQVGKI
ncbi:MAG: PIN domain-containing protein [Candidatus Daviesbacteria bacterium]|nr:PIN domain-containing protein [Candidatus Daviesbacteria bacterium]